MKFVDYFNQQQLYVEHYNALLYHNTGIIGLLGINYTESLLSIPELKQVSTFMDLFEALKHPQITSSFVSFTRDKNNLLAPSSFDEASARFVFDRNKLSYKYKILPAANQRSSFHAKRVGRFRWESEEKIKAPVYLKDGCIRIEITEDTLGKLQDLLYSIEKINDKKVFTFFKDLISKTIDNPLNVIMNFEQKDVLPPEPSNKEKEFTHMSICPYCNNEQWECSCGN